MKTTNFLKLLFFIFFSTMFLNVFSIEPVIGKGYSVKNGFIVYHYFDDSCDESKKYILCTGSTFQVESVIGDKVIIKVKSGYNCIVLDPTTNDTLDPAFVGNSYCINKSKFDNGSSDISDSRLRWDNVGPLVVPMKFQIKDFKIYPAGEIGFYWGPRLLSKTDPAKYWSWIFSVGYSKVALNDVNSTQAENTRTVDAWGGASGFVYNFGESFQFGLLGGVDFFNADGDKVTRNWISVTLGVTLLKSPEKKAMQTTLR